MKGRRTWRGLNSNCARMALPKVSAVMPVPSEMKKTVRVCMGCNAFRSLQAPMHRSADAYNRRQLSDSPRMPRPGPFEQAPKPHRLVMPRRSAGAQTRFFNFWSFPMSALFSATALVVPFENLRMTDVEAVGGKNASLGEMISPAAARACACPRGFATTAHAFRQFLAHDGLAAAHQRAARRRSTPKTCARWPPPAREIRGWIEAQPFPADLEAGDPRRSSRSCAPATPQASFAVRSSATAEDLPDASFAGQQETFLNVVGIEDVLHKMKEVFASLYNDRAISYRVHKGFAHADVALSAGVQRMVRTRPRRRRRDVHHRHRIGLRRRGLHHLQLRPGRDGGAGRREPRRVLRAQADAATPASAR